MNKKFIFKAMTIWALCVVMSTPVVAATKNDNREAVTTATKKSDKLSGKLVTKKGKTYYVVKGKKVKNKVITIKKSRYLFDENGVMVKGWAKYNKHFYFFGRSNGKQLKNRTIDGIRICKNGRAKITKLNAQKIKTMIRARKMVDKICKSTDSKEVKLRKCFDWISDIPYKRYHFLNKIYKEKGWESTFANDIFIKGEGCCVSQSSALAFMVHECGYKNVYVVHDTGHAWMELKGRVYDALFAKAKDYEKFYNLPYKDYGCHIVDKRKI